MHEETVIAILFVGFQLQTKTGVNQDQGSYIDAYKDFRKAYEQRDKADDIFSRS